MSSCPQKLVNILNNKEENYYGIDVDILKYSEKGMELLRNILRNFLQLDQQNMLPINFIIRAIVIIQIYNDGYTQLSLWTLDNLGVTTFSIARSDALFNIANVLHSKGLRGLTGPLALWALQGYQKF